MVKVDSYLLHPTLDFIITLSFSILTALASFYLAVSRKSLMSSISPGITTRQAGEWLAQQPWEERTEKKETPVCQQLLPHPEEIGIFENLFWILLCVIICYCGCQEVRYLDSRRLFKLIRVPFGTSVVFFVHVLLPHIVSYCLFYFVSYMLGHLDFSVI